MQISRIRRKSLFWMSTLAMLSLMSCEFGNKSKTVLTGYDTISGYYKSLPQSIAFRAQIATGDPRSKNGTMGEMPDYMKAIMANPTMLYFDDPVAGKGSIRSHLDTALGVATLIQDKQGTFGASGTAMLETGGCRLTQEITNVGTFAQLPVTETIAGFKVRGTIGITYSIDYTLTGMDIDCDVMRNRFKTCYIDGINCATSGVFERGFVEEMFAPLVNVGLMSDTEIGSFRSIGYTAVYQ